MYAGKKILEICSNKENSELEEIGEYRGMKLFLEISMREFVLKIKNNSLYTVTLGTDVYGNITRIDNEISNMEKHLEKAKTNKVSLLVVGDPFSATTHIDLYLRCIHEGVKVEVVNNASILNSIGITGLSLYRFGETVSIPFFTEK